MRVLPVLTVERQLLEFVHVMPTKISSSFDPVESVNVFSSSQISYYQLLVRLATRHEEQCRQRTDLVEGARARVKVDSYLECHCTSCT